jgi:hypothetical protein
MGKVLVERNEAHQDFFLQLDKVQRQLQDMDLKLDKLASKNEAQDGEDQEHP